MYGLETSVFSFLRPKVNWTNPLLGWKWLVKFLITDGAINLAKRKMLGKNIICFLSSSCNFNNFTIRVLKEIQGKDWSASSDPPPFPQSFLSLYTQEQSFIFPKSLLVQGAPLHLAWDLNACCMLSCEWQSYRSPLVYSLLLFWGKSLVRKSWIRKVQPCLLTSGRYVPRSPVDTRNFS